MTRIIVSGCNGRMGQVISALCAEDDDIEVVAGIDVNKHIVNTYPVFTSLADCNVEADALIDFSLPKALEWLLKEARQRKLPLILCATGYSKEQVEAVTDASKEIAILRSANMSLGINTIMMLVQEAAKILAPAAFDIEVLESHHNQKIDAPSGTALQLAEAINTALDNNYHNVYDRSEKHEKRDKNEIGISSIRGGSIVGEHSVFFAGTDEVVEIKHTAYSKAIFAKGAIQAAKFLSGKPAGLYTMGNVVGLQ